MRITDDHIATYKRRGFVFVEGFLAPDETADALAGFHAVFAPDHQGFLQGRPVDRTQQVFPWDHSGLNQAAVHPELVSAAERIIGTRDIRLADSDINARYAGEPLADWFHVDVGNNTLGPPMPEDHSNITIALVLTDVQPGMSPTRMVPWGEPDSAAVPMTAPAGSICIYSTFTTRHSATMFAAPAGYRATMWTIWCRADRPWEGRSFTYKSCGAHKDAALRRFIAESTPRQLEMIGFPPPGHPLWTPAYISGMAERYPGFDDAPYLDALQLHDGDAERPYEYVGGSMSTARRP